MYNALWWGLVPVSFVLFIKCLLEPGFVNIMAPRNYGVNDQLDRRCYGYETL